MHLIHVSKAAVSNATVLGNVTGFVMEGVYSVTTVSICWSILAGTELLYVGRRVDETTKKCIIYPNTKQNGSPRTPVVEEYVAKRGSKGHLEISLVGTTTSAEAWKYKTRVVWLDCSCPNPRSRLVQSSHGSFFKSQHGSQ